ncbi:hypothetical protein PtA15_6A861 [Puccinia triticina]|uniref:Uncharacterized protein n=1 Tax=Puccinia triticina TaxID=208348 RepID=A0ABY7CNI6_9BASI|nr:uncharacterized protein PtA15_6A861 [Puccinia triticina]WAQ86229.1 hypothetical protein PtA15_6A861 [Puccinia triticina]
MSSNTPTSAEQHGGTAKEQQGDNANGDSLPAHDEAWISALVDRLVPQFQAQRTATADESAMQTDRQGRVVLTAALSKGFDATGVISDEEDIKITDLSKAHPPSTTSAATKSRKRAPRVRRKPGSGKAVDLLAKTPNNLSDHPDPGNSKDLAPKLLTPTTSTGDSSASGVAEQLAMKACTQTSAPLPVPNISATPRTESTAGAIAIRAWSPLPSPRPNLSSWDTSLGIGRLTAPDQTAEPAPWPAHDNQPEQPKSPPLFNRESREGSPLPPEQPVQSRTSTTEANNGCITGPTPIAS